MKSKLFAGLIAALALTGMAAPASAQSFRHDGGAHQASHRGEGFRGREAITVSKNGRTFTVDREDRMFWRLTSRPYNFAPGLTYAYTDRCNQWGCVAFVFNDYSRRPIDRIFAPHLQMRGYAWRQTRDFDRNYRGYGRFDERNDRGWNDDDRRDRRGDDRWDDDRDDRRLEGAPSRR